MKVVSAIPSIDLHTHLRGTITPALARSLASKHGISLDETLFDEAGEITWNGFGGFLNAYSAIASTVREAKDLYFLTVNWLKVIAGEGTIYSELMLSPAHVEHLGIPLADQLSAIGEAIEAAAQFGIEARIVATCVRHHGPSEAERIAHEIATQRASLVVGFGLTGDEHCYEPHDFSKAFHIAADAGLGCTAHTGEWRGADTIARTVEALKLTRIGHGIRAAESPNLLQRLVSQGIGWEICLSSNRRLKYTDNGAEHPLPKLLAANCKISFGTDDPGFFQTTPAREYELGRRLFGLSEAQLIQVSRDAIDMAFCDESTKESLRRRLTDWSAHS